MGLRHLEAAILAELREVVGNKKLRQRDIIGWNTGNIEAVPPEIKVRLPVLRVNVVYADPSLRK